MMYTGPKQFMSKNQPLYRKLKIIGKLDKIYATFGWKKQIQPTWTEASLILDAKKYTSIKEWRISSKNAYQIAKGRKLINKITQECNFEVTKKWNKMAILEEAKKYNTKREWQKKSPSSYSAAHKLNIVKECAQHMIILRKTYTEKELIDIAKQYTSRVQLKTDNPTAYTAIQRKKIQDKVFAHLINKNEGTPIYINKFFFQNTQEASKKLKIDRNYIRRRLLKCTEGYRYATQEEVLLIKQGKIKLTK